MISNSSQGKAATPTAALRSREKGARGVVKTRHEG